MNFTNLNKELESIVHKNLDGDANTWLNAKMEGIISTNSAKDLYLTYSLLASKVDKNKVLELDGSADELQDYLKVQNADTLQVSRIYLLVRVLEENPEYFVSKVANLIQVADTGELVTFLKFLILLPNAENYKQAAVEALRTNIATVFEAISMKNPYPANYFNDQQWNQMYLKAAFMQLDLSNILAVDARANKDLSRIISDYAHERWAASRDIDPLFWRPVVNFLDDTLLKDIERLLQSNDLTENRAGALCCHHSNNPQAKVLLKKYAELQQQVISGETTWENIRKEQ